MAGSVWVMIVAGLFVLIVVVLGALLLVGKLRSSKADQLTERPEYVPHPRVETIPPTGSR